MAGRLKLKLQLMCGEEIAIGPGKAELLRQIDAIGSIAGAARAMGMSYRRAWLLVDTMNRCFRVPLLAARPGSGKRAGTRLTVAGRQILAAYEGLVTAAQAGAGGLTLELLEASLRKTPVARRPTANAA